MDYEKKYKEALELARVAAFNGHQSLMEGIFPELAESKDEKTRKRIIALVNAHGQGMYKDDMLAWLENIPYTIDREKREGFHLGYKAALEKQGESSDKIHYWTEEEIEPIISDYLRGAEHYGGMIGRLRCLKPKSLEKQGTSYTKSDVDDAYLKGISDAKNELEKQCKQNYLNYENINIQQKDFAPKPKETVKEAESNLTPLERKVKDILFSFHINAADGISFDGTMAIVHNLITLCQQEQKPAWSEEDEKEYKYVLKFVDNILNNCGNKKDYEHCKRCYDWLKSLKQRIGG